MEFQRVYTHGVKVVGRFLVLFALARESGSCRFGITATRKFGGAVVRNRARRRVRELFRGNIEALDGLAVDFVVNVRHGCEDAEWKLLTEDYLGCLKRARARLQPLVP